MGQKVHPIGFRIGIIRDWESTWYADKGYPERLKEDHLIRTLLRKRFAAAALSRIVIDRQADKVRISLFTGKPGLIIGKGGRGVDDLRTELARKFDKQVNININEIHQVDVDAQLVSESIAQQIERRISPRRAIRGALMRAEKAGGRGIKVLVSGRLGGAEIARKETEKWGKIPLHTLRADIDYGFSEARTTYGNIGVKVWIYRGEILPDERREQKSRATPEPFSSRQTRGRTGEERSGGERGGERGGDRGGSGGGQARGRGGRGRGRTRGGERGRE